MTYSLRYLSATTESYSSEM